MNITKILVLFLAFFGASIVSLQYSYANVDFVQQTTALYTCDKTTGIGTLRLRFGNAPGGVAHRMDTRYYTINHAGWISIVNTTGWGNRYAGWNAYNFFYVNGCTQENVCTTATPLAGATTYRPYTGNQVITEATKCGDPAYQYGAGWLNYFPGEMGWANGWRDWSWGYVQTVGVKYWGKTGKKDSKGRSIYNCINGTVAFRAASTIVTLTPGKNGGIPDVPVCNKAACDSTVANDTLRTTELAASEAKCSEGTAVNFSSSTDGSGKTTYTWTCEKPSAESVSCNAYYKPLCVPTATNGCCDETRSQPQCRYSTVWNQPAISMTGLVMSTQDGPTVVSLTGTTACRTPVDGKPRILCDADPFTNITGTLSSFTLSGSVTQKTGLCRVVFDAPDVCSPREDIITIKPVTPECDPTVKNINDPKYCPRTVAETTVCLKLTDKFGNPVYDYATNRIESVLDKVEKNEYYKEYNTGTDNTRYEEGTFTIASNNYCAPICTEVNGTMCCPGSTNPVCKPVLPPPTPCDPSNPSKTTCPNVPICVPTVDDPNKCDTVTPVTSCVPTAKNNYCKPPIPTTVPGCDLPDYAGDPMLCIEKTKTCTAKLEVENAGIWTDNGDSIIYDEPARYRIVVDDNDPICRNGIISIQSVSATGGTLSGSVIWAADGTFTATISRDADATPKTSRGPTVQALFTQPGGITYGLTERADDFSIPPTPLTITGERMKGVRIIGNSAGTDITNFNLNNNGVIGEQTGPSVTTARNAIIKNAALLTRGITANGDRSINDVYYAEGDIDYSTIELRGFRTLIVKGSLTIDKDISSLGSTNPGIGIIVLRDALGNGGNITVADSVQYIHALIFAEGTFKGEGNSFSDLNPKTQLVLKGTLFSRNTVGGSADLTNLYISGGAKTTERDLAFQQDLNNVRNGYGCEEGVVVCTLYRGYLDPFIIDFDNMQGDAPPGFSDLQ